MEKHIMGENGISYTLGEDGLYYPDLYLPEDTEYPIGKYGMLRKTYLKEYRKGLYLELVLDGKLNEHLHQIDEECHQMMDRLVEQMKEQQGVTEELKMQDPIGIIICKSKDKTYVEYALKNINMPIGVATYQLRNTLPEEMKEMLPEPEEIVKRLKVFEKL